MAKVLESLSFYEADDMRFGESESLLGVRVQGLRMYLSLYLSLSLSIYTYINININIYIYIYVYIYIYIYQGKTNLPAAIPTRTQ